MSTRAFGSAAQRLKSHSLRLGAATHPYYLHVPRGAAEPAPGWYWGPAGAVAPAYLAHNSHEAEYKLRRMLEDRHAAAADRHAAAAAAAVALDAALDSARGVSV